MPRIGMTYKLDELTVLRGGYGRYYGFLGQRRGDVFQSGFSQSTNIVPSLDNGLTRQQVCEVIMQLGIYAGMPAAVSGFRVATADFAERDGN